MSVAQPVSQTPTIGSLRGDRRVLRELAAISTVVVGCALVLWPLMQPGMPATHDGFLHVQRMIALDAAAREGAPFSRWLPDLAYGYGQPLLLYYAPLAYAPALILRLLGVGYIASFEVGSGLAILLSGLSMYLLGRSLFGPAASVAAAVVYAALPYQMVDLYVRGALAESWAFVWMPLAALCLIRLWNHSTWWWVTGAALSLAGLILTHNVTALLYLPALVALVLMMQAARGRASLQFTLQAAIALSLGVGLAAWFWLPAIAERGLVQIEQTIEPKLFASFFLHGWLPFRLEPFFDYQQPVSEALGYPIFWPQLGLIQAVISLAGALAVVRLRGLHRAIGVWAILLVVGGYLFQTRPFAVVYDLIPLLAFVQFPWRLLAIVGLGSALLAGVLAESLSQRAPVRLVLAGVVIAASLATALLQLNPEQTLVDERLLSTETIMRAELAEYGLGSTHSGEYLPVSSGQRNAARLRKTMLDAGSSRATPEPINLTVERVDWRHGQITAEVTSTSQAAERLVFNQFAFDGWSAKVDGQTVRTLAVGQLGLAGVSLTPGRHTVELMWSGTSTAARQLGISVSGVGVTVLLFLLASGRLRAQRRWTTGASLVLVVAAGLSGWAIPALPVPAHAAETSRWQVVDDTLALADVRLDTARLATDRLVMIRLIWLVRRAPPTGYRAFVEATATDGTTHRAPWVYEPLSRLWEHGQLTPTTVAVRLPATFPAGPADLRLVFERPTGLDPIQLGSVTVLSLPFRAASTPNLRSIQLPGKLRVSVPSDQHLTVRAGASLDVTLQWAALESAFDVEHDLLTFAQVTSKNDGSVGASTVDRPGGWFAPLPFWQAGDLIGQRIRVHVHDGASPGEYQLSVQIYEQGLARGGAAEPGPLRSPVFRRPPLTTLEVGSVTVTP